MTGVAQTNDTTSPPAMFEEQAAPGLKVRGFWGDVFYRLRHRDKVTVFFGCIVLLIVLATIFAPLVSVRSDPGTKESVIGRLKPFGWRSHPLGTDELGRDLLTRLLYGGRISLLMGVVPVCIATLIGGTLGVVGGFAGKRVNTVIMRTMDDFYAFPSVLLAVAISGAMGGGIANGMIALSLVFTPAMCRIAETATTQIKNLGFRRGSARHGCGGHSRFCGSIFSWQRPRSGFHLRLKLPGQRRDSAFASGLSLPRPWRAASHGRLGIDVEHVAAIDLRQSVDLCVARGGDFCHIDQF